MLEPRTVGVLRPAVFRAVAVRHGFDLELALPDPAPAWVDPEGAIGPVLTEPLSALRLHAFPSAGARAALTSRLLSEPGRPDLADAEDPFVGLFRHACQEGMEPEVTGCLALLLLREQLGHARRNHQPRLPAPGTALDNPSIDTFARRRARLHETDWGELRDHIQGAAERVGSDPALLFERTTLLSAAAWLRDYETWWSVAGLLGEREEIPEDRTEIRAAVDGLHFDLAEEIARGSAAEQEFMEAVGAEPETTVSARWLLSQQIRSLRDLVHSTRERSHRLHSLVRRTELARVRAQIAYRALLLKLWLADDPLPIEEAILAMSPPPHATTLGAGLGRVVGIVLLRRLRRGNDEGALELAERALKLAPEELAVRLTWNDLRYHLGPRDGLLLQSLREERERWDSVSVCLMGSRVAGGLGEESLARQFRNRLADRALDLGTAAGWMTATMETLRHPAARRDRNRLDALTIGQVHPSASTPLSTALLGLEANLDEAARDLELALLTAVEDLEETAALEQAPVISPARRKQKRAWKQLVQRRLPEPTAEDFCALLFSRLLDLRAAAAPLREPPIAGQLRGLHAELSRAAEAGILAPLELGELQGRLGGYLGAPEAAAARALADWIEAVRHGLRLRLRTPRSEALLKELDRARAQLRIRGRDDLLSEADRLRSELADGESDLDRIDAELAQLLAPEENQPSQEQTEGLMSFHPDFDRFSIDELGMRPDALRRARELVRLFNLSGGRRDRKRLRGAAVHHLFELRHRTARQGGLRVFYTRKGSGWYALAAMSKFDDRQQQEAIDRVARYFANT